MGAVEWAFMVARGWGGSLLNASVNTYGEAPAGA